MAVQLISYINNFLGLSGDSKPTDTPVGSTFYETDTTDTYVFNGSAWSAIPGTGASIGGPVSGSTAGSILYVDSSNQLAEDNANLNWEIGTIVGKILALEWQRLLQKSISP
jgi:hypothetical protein